MKHKEFIKEYAQKMDCDEKIAKQQVDAFIEVILDAMKKRDSLTIEHLGKFYIKDHKDSIAFKFTPSQKLKAILGWSTTYEGEI